MVRRKKAETGDSLAIADVDGGYTCPVCEEPGELPPADELRRLADEQGGPRIPRRVRSLALRGYRRFCAARCGGRRRGFTFLVATVAM
jgi:hypothetical protein